MKIIYIANTLMPTTRAHGYQIGKTCEKFSVFGNEVELLIPNRKNHVGDDLFEYYILKRNFTVRKIDSLDVIFLSKYIGALAFYIHSIIFSVKLFFLKIEKSNIIYSRDILPILIFKLRKFSVVYNAHNWSKKRSIFIKMFLGYGLRIVCNSEGTRKQVLRDGFNNSISVQNGVDLEEFDNLGDRLSIRKELKLPTDKKIIMYVGHLYGWKGVGIALDAAKLLSNQEDIVFIFVGGHEDDIKKYVDRIKGFKNVLFLGHKLKKDIPFYLKSADILLLPNVPISVESESYTSPLKMFEYMASGVPIIASDLPSIREVLNENNSLLVEAGNAQSIVIGVKNLLSNIGLSNRIVSQSREDVKKYTWDAYAKKILDFIAKTK